MKPQCVVLQANARYAYILWSGRFLQQVDPARYHLAPPESLRSRPQLENSAGWSPSVIHPGQHTAPCLLSQYFYVTYVSRHGGNAFREAGVLSASTVKNAEKKARKAQALYARPGWEEFCDFDNLTEISVVDYLVLKKYMFNIDHHFDEDGELTA